MNIRAIFFLLTWVFVVHSAVADELVIDITSGQEGAQPIVIIPFAWEGKFATPPVDIAAVVSADLSRSGFFSPVPERDFVATPHQPEEVNFPKWRALGAPNLVIGKLQAVSTGYLIDFRLYDIFTGTQLVGQRLTASERELRRVAHQIADIIYQTLTGQPGAFATRMAYISEVRSGKKNSRYFLNVADSDGYNPVPVLKSTQPLLSPAWSPDGARLAYVSLERGRAEIYLHEVATGKRELIAAHKGLNGAPAWSPDGTQLALVLSKEGSPDIYVLKLADKSLRRLTDSYAIDTEPAWSPDGQSIVFTSDRGGKAQIYRIAASGGPVQRLSFDGDYNARASFSPDGRSLVLVNGERNRFRIAVLNLADGAMRVLTDGQLDESPSFAPNGAIILYATGANGRKVLATVSTDGRARQRFLQPDALAREPVWGPRLGAIRLGKN